MRIVTVLSLRIRTVKNLQPLQMINLKQIAVALAIVGEKGKLPVAREATKRKGSNKEDEESKNEDASRSESSDFEESEFYDCVEAMESNLKINEDRLVNRTSSELYLIRKKSREDASSPITSELQKKILGSPKLRHWDSADHLVVPKSHV